MKRGDLVKKWVDFVAHSPVRTVLRVARCDTAAAAIGEISPAAKANVGLVSLWLRHAAEPHHDLIVQESRVQQAKAEILKLI